MDGTAAVGEDIEMHFPIKRAVAFLLLQSMAGIPSTGALAQTSSMDWAPAVSVSGLREGGSNVPDAVPSAVRAAAAKPFGFYELKYSYEDLQSKIIPTKRDLEGSWELVILSHKTEKDRDLEALENLASRKNVLRFFSLDLPHLRDYMRFRVDFAGMVDPGVDWGMLLVTGKSVQLHDASYNKMIYFEIHGIKNDSIFKDNRTQVFYNYYCRMPDGDSLLCHVRKNEIPRTRLNSSFDDSWYFGFSRVK